MYDGSYDCLSSLIYKVLYFCAWSSAVTKVCLDFMCWIDSSLFVVLADKSLAMLLRKFIKQWECSIKMLWEKKQSLLAMMLDRTL